MARVRGSSAGTAPRTRATLDAVRRDLTDDGFVYRFRHDERDLGEASTPGSRGLRCQ
ncbi:hypothetical protein MAHJHV28_47050 [Mycobacterium avium subsp. hominissuis]